MKKYLLTAFLIFSIYLPLNSEDIFSYNYRIERTVYADSTCFCSRDSIICDTSNYIAYVQLYAFTDNEFGIIDHCGESNKKAKEMFNPDAPYLVYKIYDRNALLCEIKSNYLIPFLDGIIEEKDSCNCNDDLLLRDSVFNFNLWIYDNPFERRLFIKNLDSL